MAHDRKDKLVNNADGLDLPLYMTKLLWIACPSGQCHIFSFCSIRRNSSQTHSTEKSLARSNLYGMPKKILFHSFRVKIWGSKYFFPVVEFLDYQTLLTVCLLCTYMCNRVINPNDTSMPSQSSLHNPFKIIQNWFFFVSAIAGFNMLREEWLISASFSRSIGKHENPYSTSATIPDLICIGFWKSKNHFFPIRQ